MELRKHPIYNVLVSSDGSIVQNMESGFRYSYETLRNGYLRVEFRHTKNGLRRSERKYVHRLVAETFLDRKPGKTDVDHIDRNRSNNDVSNLRWTTHKQNIRNSAVYKHGKYAAA